MVISRSWYQKMQNSFRIYNTPKGPKVYFETARIHHWSIGLLSAIIGGLGLMFDDEKKREDFYLFLVIGGVTAFLDDLPDFISYVNSLKTPIQ